ncbi:predicted protein [Lichtheimia corymbifera JMRC:FSU:9682]|uniref:Uncharacterized protein n=1 Tax=Lichtheimia corymbifera JMRC:FSU:9682 TaxID=1263082 RepID=A0A068SD22_9FUNG|nr:predicted protein [Lichtheimia corymbifera JMRC:FSU:9682]
MKKEPYQQRSQRLFLIGLATVMDEWMGAIKCSNVESWNVALVTWSVVSRNDDLYHVDTAEDDHGLDGMDKMSFIFDDRWFTTMDDIGMMEPGHATATSTIMDEDTYDGSNQEYNAITIPAGSMWSTVGFWNEREDRNLMVGWRYWITHIIVSRRSCPFCHITFIKASLFIC